MMKKAVILFCLIFPVLVYSQAEYVNVDNKVYSFLERMESRNIIDNYNSLEIPKTRQEISHFLEKVISQRFKLNKIDKNILDDLEIEFELELTKTLMHHGLTPFSKNYNFFDDKERYLYYVNDEGKINIFFRGLFQGGFTYKRDEIKKKNYNSNIFSFGAEFRGTIYDKFGFYYSGLSGSTIGNREASRVDKDIDRNFRFNNLSSVDFDRTIAGYVTADFDILKFKLGRDRMNIGYGNLKTLLGSDYESFTYFQMRIDYKKMHINTFFGKLHGNYATVKDSLNVTDNLVGEKYIGYNRIGFNFSRYFNFGVGEFLIYGDRGIDLTYLNPFNVYKFSQNDEKDRDNAMLFLDFNSVPFDGLKLYGIILMDDLEFGELGTGYWGNKFLYDFGLYSTLLYDYLPLDFKIQYVKTDPYVFSHKFERNTFKQDDNSLSDIYYPNSSTLNFSLSYRFSRRLDLDLSYTYTVHGDNYYDENGKFVNVGGDIDFQHTPQDKNYIDFLEGKIEYFRKLSAIVTFEPVNNYFIKLITGYINNDFQDMKEKYFTCYLKLLLAF